MIDTTGMHLDALRECEVNLEPPNPGSIAFHERPAVDVGPLRW